MTALRSTLDPHCAAHPQPAARVDTDARRHGHSEHTWPFWVRWCVSALITVLTAPLVLVWIGAYFLMTATEVCFRGPLDTVEELLDDGP
jgi:hypothetical protein